MRVVSRAWWFALPMIVLGLLTFLIVTPLGIALIGLAAGVIYFFRDPRRYPPPSGILSPADGRVSVIREEGARIRIGVYMSVTDVHVNRAPLAGRITRLEHRAGGHKPAYSKDSDRNERVDLQLVGDEWTIDVSLIAGTIARRITPYVDRGDGVARGERIGHIAFGSRADVLLPPDLDRSDLAVTIGERVRAGETILVRQKTHGADSGGHAQ